MAVTKPTDTAAAVPAANGNNQAGYQKIINTFGTVDNYYKSADFSKLSMPAQNQMRAILTSVAPKVNTNSNMNSPGSTDPNFNPGAVPGAEQSANWKETTDVNDNGGGSLFDDQQRQQAAEGTPVAGADAAAAKKSYDAAINGGVESAPNATDNKSATNGIGGLPGTPNTSLMNDKTENTDMLFGNDASARNILDPNFIANRNNTIIKDLTSKNNFTDMNDAQVKKLVQQDLITRGADATDPRLQQTVDSIVAGVRGVQPAKTLDDYYMAFANGQTLSATAGQNPIANQAYRTFQSVQKFAAQNPQQMAESFKNGDLFVGGSVYNKLVAAGHGPKLEEAKQLAGINMSQDVNNYLTSSFDVDDTKSLSSQTTSNTADESPTKSDGSFPKQDNWEVNISNEMMTGQSMDYVAEYQKYISDNSELNAAKQQGRELLAQINDKRDTITYLSDDIKAQVVSSGGVITKGYLAALVAEKSKPIIRELQGLTDQYSASMALVKDLGDTANTEFQLKLKQYSDQREVAMEQYKYERDLKTQLALKQIDQNFTKAQNAEQWDHQLQLADINNTNDLKKLEEQQKFTSTENEKDRQNQRDIATQNNQTDLMKAAATNGSQNLDFTSLLGGGSGTGPGSSPIDLSSLGITSNYDMSSVDNPYYRTNSTGDAAVNNNNPGNLRAGEGSIGTSGSGFAIFATPQAGWDALVKQVKTNQTTAGKNYNPNMTLQQYFAVYAPAKDKNNPGAYAAEVAKSLGVSPTAKIKDVDTLGLAKAIAQHESNKMHDLLFSNNPQIVGLASNMTPEQQYQEDILRGGNSAKMPSTLELGQQESAASKQQRIQATAGALNNVVQTIGLTKGMDAKNLQLIFSQLATPLKQGNTDQIQNGVKTLYKNHILTDEQSKKNFDFYDTVQQKIPQIKSLIDQYEANGGSMSLLNVGFNRALNSAGIKSNPNLLKITTSLKLLVDDLRRAKTGAAISATEENFYNSIIPQVGKDGYGLTTAKLDALNDAAKLNVSGDLTSAFGADTYNAIFNQTPRSTVSDVARRNNPSLNNQSDNPLGDYFVPAGLNTDLAKQMEFLLKKTKK